MGDIEEVKDLLMEGASVHLQNNVSVLNTKNTRLNYVYTIIITAMAIIIINRIGGKILH